MSFTRTQSGISNLHLFYDTDLIVFTEGGNKTFTYDEIKRDKYNTKSVDIKFWNNILKNNGFTKKVEFRAIGSKTASITICNQIISKEIKNVAVAKDRDLDEYLSSMYDSPFILYTKGYSWENDVFSKELTVQQIESMLYMAEIPTEIYTIINEAYNDFKKIGKHLVKLEIILRAHGIKFISDMNGERFFNVKKNPKINKGEIFSLLREKKVYINKPRTIKCPKITVCPFLSNYGKIIEALAITVISYISKIYCDIKSISKEFIISAMIERFANQLKISSDVYYSNLVQKLHSAV